jgi:hypothetical protein
MREGIVTSRYLIGEATYDREGNDLQTRGLYLNVSPWKAFVFSLTKSDATAT